jgi:hypothetical protein
MSIAVRLLNIANPNDKFLNQYITNELEKVDHIRFASRADSPTTFAFADGSSIYKTRGVYYLGLQLTLAEIVKKLETVR